MNYDFTTFITTFGLWSILPVIGTVIVHLAFSATIFSDANTLQNERGHTVFVNPIIWSLSVLVGGVFVALAYWVIHHSSISKL